MENQPKKIAARCVTGRRFFAEHHDPAQYDYMK